MSEPSKPNPIIRLLPSLTDLAFLMPIGLLFFVLNGAKSLLSDGDTGWHLRTGEWILTHGTVPKVDIFSFTKAGEPWYAWEWLWDVIFGWMHLHWGMEAVVIASILVLCFTFALLFRLAARQSGNVLIAIVLTLVAMVASSIHWLARPHVFTLLFVVVFLAILERVREGQTKLLWWLPLLTVVWTNLHGGFFVGIALVGTYAAGEWVAALFTPSAEERQNALKRSVRYVIAAAGCFLASFVNPYGYHLHTHIVEYLREPYHREHISEFQSVSFQFAPARFFEILLALGAVAAAWKVFRREYAHALSIILWAHLSLIAARNIPLFALLSVPFIAQSLQSLFTAALNAPIAEWLRKAAAQLKQIGDEMGSMERIGRAHLASMVPFLAACILLCAPGASGKWKAEYDKKTYPEAAIQALGASQFTSGVFTDDEWGDYLIYRLYPTGKVFVDGRSDFYKAEFGKKYLSVLDVRHDWEKSLRRYAVRTVLLPVASPLAGALKESARWRPVYDDGIAIVFQAAEGHPANSSTSFAAVRSGRNRGREITSFQPVVSRSLTSIPIGE